MAHLCHAGAVGKLLRRLGEAASAPGRRRRGGGDGVPVPKHLNWLIWRLVVERVATLQEIETFYDVLNVLDANEALDLREEAERRAAEAANKAMKKR